MKLLLAGDVMLGRGIDQILGSPCDPVLHERWVGSALDYYALAVRASGPIPRNVPADYVWGDALDAIAQAAPDVRILNLETSVTTCPKAEPKGINYRMHPNNLPALTAFAPDCCVLSNNHVLDWGPEGLRETLGALRMENLLFAGAGVDAREARTPAALPVGPARRVLVYGVGCESSGIPGDWAAGEGKPGVNWVAAPTAAVGERLAQMILTERRPGDFVVVSVHWGPNWGYEIPSGHRAFAHALIDAGAADLIHGHSAHHRLGAEVRNDRLILYGCGDFLNDYEGISGHEADRPELVLAWLAEVEDDGALEGVELLPFRIRRFRLERADAEESDWLTALMDRECARFGGSAERLDSGRIGLFWGPR
jgi:poly-gamma-glutamate synthesis protein (capsule biosynthesis protein)